MSTPIALDVPAALSRRQRLAAHTSVAAARLLLAATARRPAVLRHVLGVAARFSRRAATLAEATTIRRTLTSASLRCASPYGCQPRSVAITLWCLATRRRVTWVVGAATGPLALHAWVEAAGRPVAEPVDPYLIYQPIIIVPEKETS